MRYRISPFGCSPIDDRSGLRLDLAVEAMGLTSRSRGKKERICWLILQPVSKPDSPKAVNYNRMTTALTETTPEVTRLKVVSVDLPVPKISDQEVIAEATEACG